MKFNFRLDKVMRQRQAERDVAQREYQEAQERVRRQLNFIEGLYVQSDRARAQAGELANRGGTCASELVQIEEFISGQKLIIQQSRETVREYMSIAESKQDVLIEKTQALKALEKLKDKQFEQFKLDVKKSEAKKLDDLMVMKSRSKISRGVSHE